MEATAAENQGRDHRQLDRIAGLAAVFLLLTVLATWRHNHRKEPPEKKERALLELVLGG